MRHIIVIGGGASGMMAAISAARHGARVTILEHNDRVGKKILSTGNGRCNFTNTAQEPIFYRCDNLLFPWTVIEKYPAQKTIAFFTELGIYSRNKNGYLYPYSEQASAVLDVLRMELERLCVEVQYNEHICRARKTKKGFEVCSEKNAYTADAVILATGSKAAAFTGSDGSGYDIAKSFGHSMRPVLPALVQLRCKETFYKSLSGVRLQGKVSLFADGELEAFDTGEIQLTNYGISGIPVFQVSRYASQALYEKKKVRAELDFMPDFTDAQFEGFLRHRISTHPERRMEVFLTGLFNKKLCPLLLKLSDIKVNLTAGETGEKEIKALVKTIKHFSTEVTGTNSFEQAQVCAGGVDTARINPETMESLLVPGLYFAGEIVDVDGICGGYNLQWAWSSGYVAGENAAKSVLPLAVLKGKK